MRLEFLICLSLVALTGCGSESDSMPMDAGTTTAGPSGANDTATLDDEPGAQGTSEVPDASATPVAPGATDTSTEPAAPELPGGTDTSEVAGQGETSEEAEPDGAPDVVEPPDASDAPVAPEEGAPDTADPIEGTVPTHRVDVEITVPEYRSDALRVLLVIGDGRYPASWVRDETWTVSVDLPSESVIHPTVFFFDRDGEVLLAWTRDRSLRTTTGPVESVELSGRFQYADTDRDGVDNIDELVSGTDPDVSETALIASSSQVGELGLPLRRNLSEVSERYETRIPRERPYALDVVDPNPITIALDAAGNGRYDDSERELELDRSVTERSGTRTVGDAGVRWAGRYSRVNSERQEWVEFSSLTTRYSASTVGQVGELSRTVGGNFLSTERFSYSVVGDRSGDGERCGIQYGRFSRTASEGRQPAGSDGRRGWPQRYVTTGSASPESSELGWRFTRELLGVVVESYRVLNVDATFFCDFGEL